MQTSEKDIKAVASEEQSSEDAPSLELTEAEGLLIELASVFFQTDYATQQASGDATEKQKSQTAQLPEPLNLEARYRTLVEQIPAVVFMAYLDQGIGEAYVSPQIESSLGFSQEEWLNDPVLWYQQIHPEDKARWSIEAAEMFLSGQPLRSVYRVLARSGEVVWFHCEAKMVRRDDGRPWFIHGVAFDITELKQAEEALRKAHDELELRVQTRTRELVSANAELQLEIAERQRVEQERAEVLAREQAARQQAEEANRLKDEFLATVSHELRTPMTAIIGWTHLLRVGLLEPNAAARALETIERNARSQAQLIEDLLDISRIISGKLRLDVRQIELAEVVEAAVDVVRPAAAAKKIELQTTIVPGAVLILADPDRLQQVAWNLLSNAVKFTPQGGRVTVQLERVDSHAQITVSDTGEGISPEFLPYVFDRFRQADGSNTRTHGGLGLGLAIVRHLIELHGGTITANSRGPGQGATFIVKLPLMQADFEERRRAEPSVGDQSVALAASPQLNGLRVLLVEEELDTRELFSMALKQHKAEVLAVTSAEEALETLRQLEIDILVSDIQMPGADGYELIRKVRAMEAEGAKRIPAIALTANSRTEDQMRSLMAGYQSHLSKPVEPTELVALVATLAGRTGQV